MNNKEKREFIEAWFFSSSDVEDKIERAYDYACRNFDPKDDKEYVWKSFVEDSDFDEIGEITEDWWLLGDNSDVQNFLNKIIERLYAFL